MRRLETIKNDVEVNGSSFATKAILYSQDPGSRASGGMYTLNRNRPQMHKEFRDAVYRLREGEVSEPFETPSGWHIAKVEKIRGLDITIVTTSKSKEGTLELLKGFNFPLNNKKNWGKNG